jgi:hypothetical protein
MRVAAPRGIGGTATPGAAVGNLGGGGSHADRARAETMTKKAETKMIFLGTAMNARRKATRDMMPIAVRRTPRVTNVKAYDADSSKTRNESQTRTMRIAVRKFNLIHSII